ncbi:uncharacterized protein Z520_08930 [Fonsecaea multimorphosa CBS 102226]|uniref:AAA+ ATPase domain-containing protein n=1 Tax=Fonsecaea multimorphosa CBS 102226 TaxID=1442371 RepID=A0A0D2KFH8_9EURO|nr:uncharacterized protein Z520_08930 [Fonsecaea multimorphosa CBS 102226]KIX95413.1 hypothetical protein Z520_08930 [Fonsecaea multimorphosa CBS 102226]OAL20944.1 hypothetical protein AYO22_08364 [Fonsecaea multimorphosa]
MPATPPPQLSLSITNPLILYRTLVATKKIKPDPAQHRLALQLQKLYFRLKDYAPEIEYRYRLEKIGRSVRGGGETKRAASLARDGAQQRGKDGDRDEDQDEDGNGVGGKGESQSQSQSRWAKGKGGRIFSSLLSLRSSLPSTTLALTRTTPLHHSALSIDSPMGMLLYGEVGRGKSMLLDLLYETLPSRQKRRWHFNTFMLDVFRRIERARIERLESFHSTSSSARTLFGGPDISDHEHVMLSLAKDTVSDSPILFLDEFQMPDRAASKLINGFFTAFFHLGGVLVASSNRMPEELSKAAGIEFGDLRRTNGGKGGFFGLGWGMSRESEGERAAKTDFGLFLEVLRARCEVWEMEGERDYRREGDEDDLAVDVNADVDEAVLSTEVREVEVEVESLDDSVATKSTSTSISSVTALTESTTTTLSSDTPAHYHISLSSSPSSPSPSDTSFEKDLHLVNPSSTWTPTTLTIYGRRLSLPSTHGGVLKSTFPALCATYLGPADYVSLCSTFHTIILTDVPVLKLAQKNEARRFITLLDALYEARCRLLIQAAAPPDKLFFPETRVRRAGTMKTTTVTAHGGDDADSTESITSESFSEMYQDSTAPFRPNITSYTESNTHSSTPSFTPSLYNPNLRTVLADEDADFGPTYGNGRGHGVSDSNTSRWEVGHTASTGPDFTSTSALTGEDERFAYKRARSRLWEMCGRKWWDERLPGREDRDADAEAVSTWWRPVHRSGRFWEPSTSAGAGVVSSDDIVDTTQPATTETPKRDHYSTPTSGPDPASTPSSKTSVGTDPKHSALFKHESASPYRNHPDPPPKFGWQHAWGMMTWGKRAGEWGKGVEGVAARRGRKKHGDDDDDSDGDAGSWEK